MRESRGGIMTESRHAKGSRLAGIKWAIPALLAAACLPMVPRPTAPPPAPVTIAELPAVPVQTIISDSSATRIADLRGGRVTLTATNANLRDLLPLLANAAGVNLVMGPEVTGRVSVRFQNVRAVDALRAVIEQAGLTVGDPGPEAPWGRSVFYDLPVNVNLASAATIRARFDVTQLLADWLVKGRTF